MIAERARAIAGPDAVLVARPKSDVAHVYVGPLTPSGRYARAGVRTVCRAHTRRLSVLPERWSSLDPRPCGPSRLCARCSVCLADPRRQADRAHPHAHRSDFARTHSALTRRDFYYQALAAETLPELEAVAQLSLVVLGHRVCDEPLPDTVRYAEERLRGRRTLNQLLGHLRERLAGYPSRAAGEALNETTAETYQRAREQRRADYAEREERIRRLGFINATART